MPEPCKTAQFHVDTHVYNVHSNMYKTGTQWSPKICTPGAADLYNIYTIYGTGSNTIEIAQIGYFSWP